MIRHVVLLTWNEQVTEFALEKVNKGLAQLAETIPEIQSYAFGEDLGMYKGNADYVLMAEFTNQDDLDVYVRHPAHQAFMKEATSPILASFVSAQFEV